MTLTMGDMKRPWAEVDENLTVRHVQDSKLIYLSIKYVFLNNNFSFCRKLIWILINPKKFTHHKYSGKRFAG